MASTMSIGRSDVRTRVPRAGAPGAASTPCTTLALLAVIAAAPGAAARSAGSDFAVSWVSYTSGAGVPPAFRNPDAALGEPTRFSGVGIEPGVVSPFQPAFLPGEVVSIGPGGSLVLAFDRDAVDDPHNPFGIDLIVFGNSFFADLLAPAGICGAFFAEGGVIDVSADGESWHEVPGAVADGIFPTLGYLDAGPYDVVPGTLPSDFTRPVDPMAVLLIEQGTTHDELVALYDGSGGGAGVDLALAGVSRARYVRIRVPTDWCCTVEIDAVSVVSPVVTYAPADLDRSGAVDGADLAILLGAWGSDGTLESGGSADIDGDGTVAGSDLAILLGAWG